ncbi:MAG: hypothetical protein ABIF82_00005 [Planctomycetota bacterium]
MVIRISSLIRHSSLVIRHFTPYIRLRPRFAESHNREPHPAVYRRIARRREPKRAIVAMARHLAVKIYWQLRQIRFGEQAA